MRPRKIRVSRHLDLLVRNHRGIAVSLVKIIVITVLIILSILFLGRFFI